MSAPTHALIFALDISKTRTGLAVVRMPFITDGVHGLPEIIHTTSIKDPHSTGTQRIWWPTALNIFTNIHQTIYRFTNLFPDDYPIFAYESPAWGQATSEMMVYLQQRLFEYFGSHPLTDLDIFGFGSAFCRKVTRIYTGRPHQPTAKLLAKDVCNSLKVHTHIADTLWHVETAEYGIRNQDEIDAVLVGLTAALVAAQYLVIRYHDNQPILHLSASQEKFDNISKQTPDTGCQNNQKVFREIFKDLKTREPHLSTTNPYNNPTHTLRVLYRDIQKPADVPGFVTGRAISKTGKLLSDTLIHDHVRLYNEDEQGRDHVIKRSQVRAIEEIAQEQRGHSPWEQHGSVSPNG